MQNATNYIRIITLDTCIRCCTRARTRTRRATHLTATSPMVLAVRRSVARRQRSWFSSPEGLLQNLTMHTLPAPKTMAISNAACLRIRIPLHACTQCMRRFACERVWSGRHTRARARDFMWYTRILCVSELGGAWSLSTSLPFCRRIKARFRAACVCVVVDVLVVLVTMKKRARVLVAFARYDRTDRAVQPYTQIRGQFAMLLEWTCENMALVE